MTIFKKEKNFLIVLFFISLLIRAAVFQFYLSKNGNYWQIDSGAYHELAVSISKGKGIVDSFGHPSFYRVPGYSIFLSLFYKIAGADYQGDQYPKQKGVFLALWMQIILASFIPLLIFWLSLTLLNSILLAKIASLWAALHLGLVLYSGFFMAESLFLIFFLLFVVLFLNSVHLFFCPLKEFFSNVKVPLYEYDSFNKVYSYGFCIEPGCESLPFIELFFGNKEHVPTMSYKSTAPLSINSLFVAGLFLGLVGIVRPVGHYLFALSCLMILFSNATLRNKFFKILALMGGFIFPIAPWLLRNYALLGAFFFHTLPGIHFLYLSAARVAMHEQQCSYWEARENLKNEWDHRVQSLEVEKGRRLNAIEHCIEGEHLAVKYFVQNPFLTLKTWATDICRTFLSLYSAELLYLDSGRKEVDYFRKGRSIWSMFERYLFPATENVLLKAVIYYEIITYLFILIGFFIGFIMFFVNFIRSKKSDIVRVIACAWMRSLGFMILFLIISLAGGYARMRLPIEPFLIIFSLSYWIYLFELYGYSKRA